MVSCRVYKQSVYEEDTLKLQNLGSGCVYVWEIIETNFRVCTMISAVVVFAWAYHVIPHHNAVFLSVRHTTW